jgi:hypothetical protein
MKMGTIASPWRYDALAAFLAAIVQTATAYDFARRLTFVA